MRVFDELNLLRFVVLGSVLIYLAFDFFESRRTMDEREELIQLKTMAMVQRLTMWTLTAIAIVFMFDPHLPAFFPIMALVLSSLYSEILAKIYFRRKF